MAGCISRRALLLGQLCGVKNATARMATLQSRARDPLPFPLNCNSPFLT